jgi:NPCBM-associated, NEW3 domain of alpha-galactosidase/Gametolysin peptidase M11
MVLHGSTGVNTLGEQQTLVMMVNFQDKVSQPWTVDQVRSVFGTVSNFFLENSYNQTWLNTKVVGWYTLPVSSTTCDTAAIASYAKSAATGAGVNLSAYSHYVYVFPTISCNWVGTSTVGGNPSEAWINNELRLDVVAHEMGHNFGLHHSHSLVCNNTGDTNGTAPGPNCFSLEYGDGVDIMGWSHEGAHYNAFMKEFLGWLNKGVSPPITTVQTSGTYVLDPYETLGSNPKALKILKGIDPATGHKIFYYIEYRQVAGFDSYLADAGSLVMDAGNILNGVLIHTGSPDESSNTSFLLDMTPETYQLYAHDPALDVGKSFSDSVAGVTITPLWVNSGSAGVSVSFSQSSCTHANPAVAISPSSQSGQAGSALSYSVAVTNKDSAGCGGSTFGLQASVPAGWTAAFGASALTLSPGTSGSTTLTVTSPATATAGSYNVGVTASSGSYAASASAIDSITSTSSLSTTLTTDKSIYAGGDTVTISDMATLGGKPVVNASVSITITKPNGVKVVQSGMTNGSGTVTTKLKLNRQKDPAGIYQVVATVTNNGATAQANKSFTVQ